jgi:PAS domain S-box-containing protein
MATGSTGTTAAEDRGGRDDGGQAGVAGPGTGGSGGGPGGGPGVGNAFGGRPASAPGNGPGKGSGGGDGGWLVWFRRVPIGVRIFLVVFFNIVGLVLVAWFIAKGAAGVDAAGAELQRVRRVERVFSDIDAETGHITQLIQRYFVAPDDGLLDDIEARKDVLFRRIVDAYPYDDDISDEIRRAGDTTRALLAGFAAMRTFNERLRDLYQKDFMGALGGISVRLTELDHAEPLVPDLDRLVVLAREQLSAAQIESNTYFHTRRETALVAARLKIATLGDLARQMRAARRNADTATIIDGLETGLQGARDGLDRLAEALTQQSRQMQASISENETTLAAGIERVATRIHGREAVAHDQLEAALAAMRQRVVLVGVLFVVGSLAASLAIAVSIGRPISELRATMLAIVQGDTGRVIRGTRAADEIGAMARAVEIFRENVVARHRADLERQAQERRWRSLLETSPIGISVLAADTGERLYANNKFRALFGIGDAADERTRVRPFHENFAHGQDAIRLSEAVKRFGAVSGWEVRMRRGEGAPDWWCLMEVRPIEFEGRAAHIFWHYDVTDRRRAEDELRAAKDSAEAAVVELKTTQESLIEAEKLAAIGGLVAGVAHEVNNPVGISLTVASSLGERAEAFGAELAAGQIRRSRLDEFVAASREATTLLVTNLMRAADLVQSFKQVAVDRVHAERRRFDLKETLDQIVASLRPSLKTARHRMVADIPDGVEMDSYPGQLGQVVTNLFMNALTHAFGPDDDGMITLTARVVSAGRIELVCADNGLGMSEETKRRAFDPFFTTRRGAGGTGLGLHIVYNIVTMRLGGIIALDSVPGQGTRFVIELPTVAPTEVAVDATGGPGKRNGGGHVRG